MNLVSGYSYNVRFPFNNQCDNTNPCFTVDGSCWLELNQNQKKTNNINIQ